MHALLTFSQFFHRFHFYRCDSIIRRYHPDFEGMSAAWSDISGLLLDRIQMFGFPQLLPPNFVHILGSGLAKDPPALSGVSTIAGPVFSKR